MAWIDLQIITIICNKMYLVYIQNSIKTVYEVPQYTDMYVSSFRNQARKLPPPPHHFPSYFNVFVSIFIQSYVNSNLQVSIIYIKLCTGQETPKLLNSCT